jgi:hypothetical protein
MAKLRAARRPLRGRNGIMKEKRAGVADEIETPDRFATRPSRAAPRRDGSMTVHWQIDSPQSVNSNAYLKLANCGYLVSILSSLVEYAVLNVAFLKIIHGYNI